jgi:quinol monooxygenase YgiN
MSIRVVAKHVVKDGVKGEFVATLQELVEKTRLEKGCISYSLYESVDYPNIVTMLEEWEGKEALDAHMKSEHFTRIIPQTGKFLASPVSIDSYQKQLI